MPNIGPAELILILAIALIVFGPKKLPEIGRGVGNALREFNKARNDLMDSLHGEPDRNESLSRSTPEPGYTTSPAAALPPPEGTAHRQEYARSLDADSADALPYGSDFHAVEGDSQPSFRTAQPETPPAALAAQSNAHSGAPAGARSGEEKA